METHSASHVIDCSVQPMIPETWEIRGNQIVSRFQGKLIWDPKKIRFHLDPAQYGDGTLKGYDLKEKLSGQPVLTANVLDYLLDHWLVYPEIIPLEWQEKVICFWGTIYNWFGHQDVLCLRWGNLGWCRDKCSLNEFWGAGRPAAVLEV